MRLARNLVAILAVMSPVAASPAHAQPALPTDALARLGQMRLRHADLPTCVVFAADGRTVFTGGDDGAIRAWSVATGEPVAVAQRPGSRVTALRATHGRHKLAARFNSDGVLRFYDPATLREIGTANLAHQARFDLSANGTFLATADAAGDGLVVETVADLPKLELGDAHLLALRPDGKAVATCDADGNLAVRLLTGGKPTFGLKLNTTVYGLAYSPDGARLAVGMRLCDTDAIRVYDGVNEKPVAEIKDVGVPRQWLDATRLACGDGTDAGVYDFAKKRWLGRVKGVTGEFAVSPDGSTLAAVGTGLRVRLYDLASGKQLHAENDTYPDPPLMLGAADGRTLFVVSGDAAYHYPVGAAAPTVAGKLPGRAVAAAFGGGTLVVAAPEAVLVYENCDPFKPLPQSPTHTLKGTAGAKAVAVAPDGKRIAWAFGGGKVVAADPDGAPRLELPVTTTSILALAISPNGRLAVLGREPFMRVWDVSPARDEPREVWKARVQRGIKGAVCFSPDGKLLAAGSTGQLQVFDAADGKDDEPRGPLYQLERSADNGPVHQAAFTADGRYLVLGAGRMSGRVEVWELATRGLARTFSTSYGGVSRLCVFPDGRRLASAGAEEAVTVWDATFRAGKPAATPSELRKAVADLSDLRAAVGLPAVRLLSSAGEVGVAQLAMAVKDTFANDKKLKELVADLGSDTYSIREAAERQLVAQGARALVAVRAACESNDPEVRSRARDVMGRLNAKGIYPPDSGLIADRMRLFRAVQALEEVGTASAKAVLAEIATAGGRPAEEAKTALARLGK
jgi:WD40 repeat protein